MVVMDGFAHKGVDNQAHEGKTNVWLTPRFILDALGPFDLDPCAEPDWPVATRSICLPTDGLKESWVGLVFMNPPYGKSTPQWLEKLARHGNGIALVFSRTDTKWFQRAADQCSAMMFLSPRLTFLRPDHSFGTNSGCGSCLVAFGDVARARLFQSKLRGVLMSTIKLCEATPPPAGGRP